MGITHVYVSSKDDGADTSLVRPSNWNATHAGTLGIADLAADVASTANITTHAALTTGVHGVGTSLIASTANITSAMTTHAALTTGIHGLGTISGAASADYFLVTASTTHAAATAGIHGIAAGSAIATTAEIATHAGLTASHGAGTILSTAAATVLIKTHSDLTASIHGIAAGSTIATTAEIATHAGLTATHGAGTILSVAAATALITTHAGSTDAHIGGAGTVLSTAAGTVLIQAHNASTTAHGRVWVVASSVSVTGTALTNITGFTFACASATTYKFEALISASASHTTGVMYAFAYTGSNALIEAQLLGYGASTAVVTIAAMTTWATKSAAFDKTTGTAAVRIEGILKIATTTGTFSLQHCAGSVAATSYVRALSVFGVENITAGGAK
jgi:hypothetical protein